MEQTQVILAEPLDSTNYFEFNRKYLELAASEHDLERYENRTEETSFSLETRKALYEGKVKTCWKGLICIKDPCTLVILQQLLWDIKPKTILEFGANSGGSALYLADMMKSYGCETHVYSMDINLELLGPLAREKREDITFLQGDCNTVEKTFSDEFLKTLPHPWFVLEDAHVNTFGVLNYVDQFTTPGDYILVEDTDPTIPSDINDLEGVVCGEIKMDHLKAFMKKHSERYLVDKRYSDFFGYNGSFNMNGYIKRI